MSCVVLIPIYKSELSITEKAVIRNCFDVLKKQKIVFVAPDDFDSRVINMENYYVEIEYFDKSFF